jgi:hypothetical protein
LRCGPRTARLKSAGSPIDPVTPSRKLAQAWGRASFCPARSSTVI